MSHLARIRYSDCLFCSRRASCKTGSTIRSLMNWRFSEKTTAFCSPTMRASICSRSSQSSFASNSSSVGRVAATIVFAWDSTADFRSAANAPPKRRFTISSTFAASISAPDDADSARFDAIPSRSSIARTFAANWERTSSAKSPRHSLSASAGFSNFAGSASIAFASEPGAGPFSRSSAAAREIEMPRAPSRAVASNSMLPAESAAAKRTTEMFTAAPPLPSPRRRISGILS